MPPSFAALRFRRFKRQFGIAAPRLTVRRHIAWHWYALAIMILVAAVVLAARWLVPPGGESGLLLENEELRRQLASKTEELRRFRAQAATEQSAVEMERSAQHQLLARIRTLEQEGGKLKEELSILERLVKECPGGKQRNVGNNGRTGG